MSIWPYETSFQHGIEVGRLLEPGRFQEYSGLFDQTTRFKGRNQGIETKLVSLPILESDPFRVSSAVERYTRFGGQRAAESQDSDVFGLLDFPNLSCKESYFSPSSQLRGWRKIAVPNWVCLSGSGIHLLVSLIEETQFKFQYQMELTKEIIDTNRHSNSLITCDFIILFIRGWFHVWWMNHQVRICSRSNI
jgi:hypothetical protein